MKNENEGMDCKKLTLLFLQKLWVAALAAVFGAALGGGIYLLHHVALDKNREYRAESKLYLDFASDASEEVYQEYNGYTWNDLLSTDWILDTTMSYLPDSYTEEEVIAASLAQILSDLRLLTITVTTADAERTAAILEATDRALVELGEEKKEFLSIEVIKETEPELVTADPRLLQAAIAGSVISLAFALLALALLYVLDDKIYVPYDLKSVTALPFAGFSWEQTERGNREKGNQEKGNQEKGNQENCLAEKLRADLEQNRAYLEKRMGRLALAELEEGTGRLAVAELEEETGKPALAELEEGTGKPALAELEEGTGKPALAESEEGNAMTGSVYEKLRRADGVLLVVSYGKTDRASLAYQIEQLELQECKPAGILIKNADMRFLKWYYNHL